MTTYTTPRLTLSCLEADQAGELLDFELRNRDFFRPWEPIREEGYFTPEGTEQRILAENQGNSRGSDLILYLRLAGQDRIIGRVALTGISMGPFQSCFLGYKLDRNHTGRGLMTEAVGKILEIGELELGLHRVQANIIPRNEASRRVVERLGFSMEGLSRRYLRINGRWEDHLQFVRLLEGDSTAITAESPRENTGELEQYIHTHIPVVQKSGFRVETEALRVRVGGRLADHVNHRGSAFGGSLGTAMTLSAWGQVRRMATAWGYSRAVVVIQNQQVRFLAPVTRDFFSINDPIPESEQTRVRELLERFGKAKLTLHARVYHHGEDRARADFRGTFVVFAGDDRA